MYGAFSQILRHSTDPGFWVCQHSSLECTVRTSKSIEGASSRTCTYFFVPCSPPSSYSSIRSRLVTVEPRNGSCWCSVLPILVQSFYMVPAPFLLSKLPVTLYLLYSSVLSLETSRPFHPRLLSLQKQMQGSTRFPTCFARQFQTRITPTGRHLLLPWNRSRLLDWEQYPHPW